MPAVAPARTLAPDLARGVMLLLIAAANIPWHLWRWQRVGVVSHPSSGSRLDRAAQVLTMVLADYRVYPMFAFFLGYSMVLFAEGRRRAGNDERGLRGMLRRRHWGLLGLGLLHGGLLFEGDILGCYGLCGLLLVWCFWSRRDKTVSVWAAVMATCLVLLLGLMLLGSVVTLVMNVDVGQGAWSVTLASGTATYLGSVGARLATWASQLVLQGLMPVVPVCILLGWLAARHRVLEDPQHHQRLLRVTAVIGLPLGLAGGAVNALGHLGLLGLPQALWWALYPVAIPTGLLGGLGYVALFGLLGRRLAGRTSGPLRLVTAIGKRSLSCYLLQSVLWAPLLDAWGLGLGGRLGSAGALLVAVATWLLLGMGALLLEHRGARGPFEVVLRRVTYGRRSSVSGAAPAPPEAAG